MKKSTLFSIGIVYLTILFFNSSTVIAHDNLPCYLKDRVPVIATSIGNLNSAPTPSQYSLHRSELITDFAITATLGLTHVLIPLDRDSQRLFPDEANSLDKWIRDRLHTKSDNFLNDNGSLYTPFAAAILMTGLNLIEDASFQKTGSDLLIFANGALANGFLTQSFKRAFSRRRPIFEFADAANKAALNIKETNHKSFYSGHTATAFYSTAFLRRRISQSLTQNGHSGIKSGYQWLTGVTLYSWAAYVGYSRIEIDKHYLTDVVMGSVMGMLFEEIYYRFNQKYWNSHPSWHLTSHATQESFQFHFAKLF